MSTQHKSSTILDTQYHYLYLVGYYNQQDIHLVDQWTAKNYYEIYLKLNIYFNLMNRIWLSLWKLLKRLNDNNLKILKLYQSQ